ncbi:MAG TPA: imidazole glycerol phosphate synthase subunit HisH [Deltaproteobacteria bacterium]|nr:MAG: imidazole glycerol phosphate synthase subunit HisH [bacterium]HDH10319.1 imidazole glycerol phosphate synthase subunit HisH [Deltaproteobacteria bacterium]
MIVIVDYGRGNLRSVQKSLEKMRIACRISDKPDVIDSAEGIIFPGVGAFKDAMETLDDRGLRKPLKKYIASGKPFLGICLGLQLLFEYGTEYGKTKGLEIFKGKVVRFQSEKLRIPHMGWNRVHFDDSPLFAGITQDSYFYFVHSYYAECEKDEDITAVTEYGCRFVSAVKKENVYAVQFHPEKSGENGLKIIKNFGEIVDEYYTGN